DKRILWGGLALLVLIGVAAGVWALTQRNHSLATSAPRTVGPIGGAADCQRLPDFVKTIGFKRPAIDTTGDRTLGLVLLDAAASHPAEHTYQHPSWSTAGYLGSHIQDKYGNIYVTPAPRVDLLHNPPELQDRVYRVDTRSGELKEYVELPSPQSPSQHNPFGAMGLAYDCQTDSLYVSSLAGSTRTTELGRI